MTKCIDPNIPENVQDVGRITQLTELVLNKGGKEFNKGRKEFIVNGDHEKLQNNPYVRLGETLGILVAEKQEAYGDSFGKSGVVLKFLYPDGVQPEQYTDMLCIVRILDKLFRIATHKDAFGENPYNDIVGYGLLGAVKEEINREDKK